MWYRTRLKRLVIIIAIVVSISAVSSSALIQKYGTTLVIVPIIIGATVAIAINLVYWRQKWDLNTRCSTVKREMSSNSRRKYPLSL